jgi:uncharacterized protein YjgD (DUF1641 family)
VAEPTEAYPESATLGKDDRSEDGRADLEAALADHGGDLAAAIETTDDLAAALTTATLVAASVDDDEIDHLTDATVNLVRAVDGVTTEEAAELAEVLGEDADELAATMERVLDLQREGHLDDLVALAKTAAALEIDEETVTGLNTVLGAVGEAQRESKPTSVFATIASLRSRDVRSGMGYCVAVLKALGRRLTER